MPVLFVVFAFILGAIIGSFLNVVILRWNTGASIAADRSRCFSCGKPLRWYELVPLASFIVQRGRCRRCGSRISWQYPLVEAATGLLFAAIIAYFSPISPDGLVSLPLILYDIVYFVIASLLVVITVYDLRHKIIPDVFSYAFAALGLIVLGLHAYSSGGVNYWDLLAGPLLALPFFLLWLVSRGTWMGLGDAKLALGIGWFLGLNGGGAAIILGFWLGAIVGLILIAVRRVLLKSEIPFAPFLVAGTLIVFFTGLTFTALVTFL